MTTNPSTPAPIPVPINPAERADWFSLDDGRTFPGWGIPSQRWNGWACPSFDWRTACDIAHHVTYTLGSETPVRYDEETRTMWEEDYDGTRYYVTPYEMPDGTIRYPLGSHGWVWTDVSTFCDWHEVDAYETHAVVEYMGADDTDGNEVAWFDDLADAIEYAHAHYDTATSPEDSTPTCPCSTCRDGFRVPGDSWKSFRVEVEPRTWKVGA